MMDAGRRVLEGKLEVLDGFVRSEVGEVRELVKKGEADSLTRERGLREHLSGLNRTLRDAIQEQALKFGAEMEEAAAELGTKTGREELGDLLAELSERLRGDAGASASNAGVRVLQN